MLTNDDLSSELEALAAQARELAAAVKSNGDLPARQLALGIVEAGKIGEKLAKLQRQLGSNGDRLKCVRFEQLPKDETAKQGEQPS